MRSQRTRARRRRPAARRRARPRLTLKQQAARRERRIRGWIIAAMAGIVAVIAGVVVLAPQPPSLPDVASVVIDPDAVPAMTVAGYDHEQLVNAAVIVDVGNRLGLGTRDQAIAVMTAMGESSLNNIDYGDWETSGRVNPDGTPTSSIGLFQQQDWWGSTQQRMDPATSAELFYEAMVEDVPDRDALAPTLVAHRTQVNDDSSHYEPYWEPAVAVVAALAESQAAD